MKLRNDEVLQLAGWCFEPSRILAKLRHADKSLTYTNVTNLLHAAEYVAGLKRTDQEEGREMAWQAAA